MTHTVARLAVAGVIVLAAVWPPARAAERFDVTTVADGVYLISRTDVLAQPLDGNTVVIVGTDGVAVVDSTQTSTSANAVIAEIRRLTPAPVKYLINTHWHNDHVLGNGAYVAAFPGVQIVAHALTRDDIESEASAVLANRIRGLANRGQAQATLDAGRTAAGVPLSRAEIHRLRERLAMPASHLEDLKAIVVTPPTVTYRGRMTLHLGGREVQLFSNGPGNTRSDTVVWLPADRVVATGDLLVSTVPFMSVSFPRGWLARLEEIEALTPAVIIPGHGPAQRDLTWLHRHAALLESLITQVDAALDKGLTLAQTRASVNLDAFRNAYAGGDPFLADEFDFRVTEPAVADAYRERVGHTVSGVVFIDANGNGIHDRGERGLANAVVSNQDAVVATDASGAYRLPRRTTGVLFVSVPDGYRMVGAFWRTMESATSTVDFPLSPTDRPAEFTFIHASDPHIAPAVLARTQRFRALADALNPAFVLVTGDLVRDALRVGEAEATGYYTLFNHEAGLFKNPVWTVPGNHEIFGVERDRSRVSTTHPLYGRLMYHHYRGPDYYSFTFGGVHFVGLNTVDVDDQSYYGHVDSLQLAWLERDLAMVPPEMPVVTFSHIPFFSSSEIMGGYTESPPAPTLITVNGKTVFRHTVSNAGAVVAVLRRHRHVLALGGHIHAGEQIVYEVDGLTTRFNQAPAIVGPRTTAGMSFASGFTLYTVRGGVIDPGRFVPLGLDVKK